MVDNVNSLSNPDNYFVPGDEVLVGTFPNFTQAWVTAVSGTSVAFQDRDGNAVNVGSDPVRVIRSGRRNQQGMPIGSITTLSDPIQGNNLVFNDILNAGAIEFKDDWVSSCYCTGELVSANPYVNGEKGNYRPVKSYAYLTERNQSNDNRNTNIRVDGTFEDFQPYWMPNVNPAQEWNANPAQWTFASEVTLVSPYGMELENRDALERYSAAEYGYNNTLPTAVASNSMYREIGFDNFEDYDCTTCSADRFGFKEDEDKVGDYNVSHTGKKSIKLKPGESAEMKINISSCPVQ